MLIELKDFLEGYTIAELDNSTDQTLLDDVVLCIQERFSESRSHYLNLLSFTNNYKNRESVLKVIKQSKKEQDEYEAIPWYIEEPRSRGYATYVDATS